MSGESLTANLKLEQLSGNLREQPIAGGGEFDVFKGKEEGKEKVILFNFSGHGLMDLVGYEKYFNGELTNTELSAEDFEKFTAVLKNHPSPII